MAGTCKQCGEQTTDTRSKSPSGKCFNCEHGLPKDLVAEKRDVWSVAEDAPEELIELISIAMCEYGPDGHCDGADKIAAVAYHWLRENKELL